MIITSI